MRSHQWIRLDSCFQISNKNVSHVIIWAKVGIKSCRCVRKCFICACIRLPGWANSYRLVHYSYIHRFFYLDQDDYSYTCFLTFYCDPYFLSQIQNLYIFYVLNVHNWLIFTHGMAPAKYSGEPIQHRRPSRLHLMLLWALAACTRLLLSKMFNSQWLLEHSYHTSILSLLLNLKLWLISENHRFEKLNYDDG